MISYFRKTSAPSNIVSATLMVGQFGTSAGQVGYCGSDGHDLSKASITCENGVQRQSIDASICKPLNYNNASFWTQIIENGKVVTYTRTTGTICADIVSITPSEVPNFTTGSIIHFTVTNLQPNDTDICYAVKEHPHNPNGAVIGASGCELESNWVPSWEGNSDWTKTAT